MHQQRTIQELAFQLWEARGRSADSAEQDWLDAERQVFNDAPPSNAPAKWEAAGLARKDANRRASTVRRAARPGSSKESG
jgi:hypothetical protein